MKPRTVMVQLQLETNIGLRKLSDERVWQSAINCHFENTRTAVADLHQIQVNVAQPPKAKKGAKRGAK